MMACLKYAVFRLCVLTYIFCLIQEANCQCSGGTQTSTAELFKVKQVLLPDDGSPNYGTSLDLCWHIQKDPTTPLPLLFLLRVTIGSGDDLRIYEGSSTAGTAKIQRTNTVGFSQVDVFSSGELFAHFTSDFTTDPAKDIGFSISYLSGRPEGIASLPPATAISQFLTTPHFPLEYGANAAVTSTLTTTDPNEKITIKLIVYDIEAASGCSRDSLVISDPNAATTQVFKLCGTNFMPTNTYTSAGNTLTATFSSDDFDQKRGFAMEYSQTTTEMTTTTSTTTTTTTATTTTTTATTTTTTTTTETPIEGTGGAASQRNTLTRIIRAISVTFLLYFTYTELQILFF